ncbi:MAG: hypothetical protein ACK559_10210, partial [bacterium]
IIDQSAVDCLHQPKCRAVRITLNQMVSRKITNLLILRSVVGRGQKIVTVERGQLLELRSERGRGFNITRCRDHHLLV